MIWVIITAIGLIAVFIGLLIHGSNAQEELVFDEWEEIDVPPPVLESTKNQVENNLAILPEAFKDVRAEPTLTSKQIDTLLPLIDPKDVEARRVANSLRNERKQAEKQVEVITKEQEQLQKKEEQFAQNKAQAEQQQIIANLKQQQASQLQNEKAKNSQLHNKLSSIQSQVASTKAESSTAKAQAQDARLKQRQAQEAEEKLKAYNESLESKVHVKTRVNNYLNGRLTEEQQKAEQLRQENKQLKSSKK